MPKLPKGMYRRARRFYVRLYEDGQEFRRSLGADYQEACRKLRRIRRGSIGTTVTVKAVMPQWLEESVRTGRNEKGYSEAHSRARRLFLPFLGHRRISSVTVNDLRAYRLWLEGHGLAPATVAYALGDARAFFYWCVESQLLDRAPVPRRLLPRLPERPPERLTEEEVQILASLPDPHGFVLRLALATGLRWGELVRAQRADVQRGILLIGQTKSGRVRRVPLSRDIQAELSGRVGRLVPSSSVGSFTRVVRERSEIERFHMHMTRHTFACRYLERGGSLHVLQQILGHSSVLVTQRYAKLTDEAVLSEFRRLEAGEGLWGQTGTETGTVEAGRRGGPSCNVRSDNAELA